MYVAYLATLDLRNKRSQVAALVPGPQRERPLGDGVIDLREEAREMRPALLLGQGAVLEYFRGQPRSPATSTTTTTTGCALILNTTILARYRQRRRWGKRTRKRTLATRPPPQHQIAVDGQTQHRCDDHLPQQAPSHHDTATVVRTWIHGCGNNRRPVPSPIKGIVMCSNAIPLHLR